MMETEQFGDYKANREANSLPDPHGTVGNVRAAGEEDASQTCKREERAKQWELIPDGIFVHCGW